MSIFFGNSHLPKVPFLRKPAMSVYQMPLLMVEMLHQLIGSLSHYLQGVIYPRLVQDFWTINSTVSPYRGSSHFEVYHVGHELEKSILVGEFAIERSWFCVFLEESVGNVWRLQYESKDDFRWISFVSPLDTMPGWYNCSRCCAKYIIGKSKQQQSRTGHHPSTLFWQGTWFSL